MEEFRAGTLSGRPLRRERIEEVRLIAALVPEPCRPVPRIRITLLPTAEQPCSLSHGTIWHTVGGGWGSNEDDQAGLPVGLHRGNPGGGGDELVDFSAAALAAALVVAGTVSAFAQDRQEYYPYSNEQYLGHLEEHRSSGIGPTLSGCGGAVGQTCATQTGVNSSAGSGGVAGGMGR